MFGTGFWVGEGRQREESRRFEVFEDDIQGEIIKRRSLAFPFEPFGEQAVSGCVGQV